VSIDLKLNAGHDLALDSTCVVLVDGAARVRQQIKVTLLTWLGEYFLDVTFGVPYLESILVKRPNRAEVESVLRQRITAVPGVLRVTRMDIQIDREARQLRVDFQAATSEGLVTDLITLE